MDVQIPFNIISHVPSYMTKVGKIAWKYAAYMEVCSIHGGYLTPLEQAQGCAGTMVNSGGHQEQSPIIIQKFQNFLIFAKKPCTIAFADFQVFLELVPTFLSEGGLCQVRPRTVQSHHFCVLQEKDFNKSKANKNESLCIKVSSSFPPSLGSQKQIFSKS